jgi:predicted AlkP superfamily phosphohydrolase/phosphomutase
VQPRRVIALSIEVAGADQIDRWCRAGHLPNLERLRRKGCWGRLESVGDLSSGCIWPSFATGTSAAKHGTTFYHMALLPGTYRVVKRHPEDVKREPFWMRVQEAGGRSVVIDVPMTAPVAGFDGVQVFAWGVEAAGRPRSSHPPGLLDDLLRRFGPHPLARDDDRRRFIRPVTRERHEELAQLLLAGVESKGRLIRSLARSEPWQLLLGVFGESHWADHVLFQALDPSHPDHCVGFSEAERHFFRDLFEAHDAAIGAILEEAPDATVLLFSGSGMKPTYSGNHLLPDVLGRLGYGPRRGGKGERASRTWAFYRIRALQDLAPPAVISAVRRLLPARAWESWTRRIAFAGSGWARSKAFCLMNDFAGSIRINLEGREPRGSVRASEYDAVCEELTAALLELEYADSGRPAVERVIKVHDELRGENAGDLPDLSVVWNAEAPVTGLRSPRIGTVRGLDPERRPGGHSKDGFLILSGPGIAPGRTLEGAHLLDLAPTILHLLGVAVPRDLDGRVLREALASSARLPVQVR